MYKCLRTGKKRNTDQTELNSIICKIKLMQTISNMCVGECYSVVGILSHECISMQFSLKMLMMINSLPFNVTSLVTLFTVKNSKI